MKHHTLSWLGLLLGLQLALASGLYWQQQQQARPAQKLLPFTQAQIDKIVMFSPDIPDGNTGEANDSSAKNTSVVFVKNNGQWQLPDYFNAPVDTSKITLLLNQLSQFDTRNLVATSDQGQTRFDVAPQQFQRHLEVYVAGQKHDVFIGKAGNLNHAYVRLGGAREIYNQVLNTADFPGKTVEWLDKSALKLSAITAIEGADFKLTKAEDAWRLFTVDNHALTVEATKATQLANALEQLTILTASDHGAPTQAKALLVKTPQGQLRYEWWSLGEQFWVKRSDRNVTFGVAKSDFEVINAVSQAQLLAPAVAPEAKPADTVSPAGAAPPGQ